MNKTKPILPRKGSGKTLRKLYDENRKKSKPSPVLLEVLKQQKIDEAKGNRSSADKDSEI